MFVLILSLLGTILLRYYSSSFLLASHILIDEEQRTNRTPSRKVRTSLLRGRKVPTLFLSNNYSLQTSPAFKTEEQSKLASRVKNKDVKSRKMAEKKIRFSTNFRLFVASKAPLVDLVLDDLAISVLN